ncbi:MAG: DNA polymerase III subunit beta [Polyangiaceae bacterium]
MQVTVSKKDLVRLLQRCQGVADKKSTMPVLGNVLLEVSGPDQLRLAATDLYLAVSGSIKAKVDKGGSVAVGARDLFERVKMMPEGDVSLTSNDTAQTTVKSVAGARRYTLHGIPGEEFPTLPKLDDGATTHTMDVDVLSQLITRTHFSISTDETRLHLNSALFEWDGDRVRMVTTDGHRLSKMDVTVAGAQASTNMLIPLKGIQELRRLCDEAANEAAKSGDEGGGRVITMGQSGPNAFFQLGGLHFSVKLVDAQFPPYDQVIPDSTERAIRMPRSQMAEALKAVALAASDRTGGVKLTIFEGKVRFESESPESGEGFDEITVDYDGPSVTVGFNARYFLDVLSAMDEDEVILGISGDLDPAVLRPGTESAKASYLAVVMPMRI